MSKAEPQFDRLALIGAGLLGSSIARACRRGQVVRHIAVTSRSEATRARIRAIGFADSVWDSVAECVQDADLVIICAHLSGYEQIAKDMAAHLKPGAIISDVGSAKACVSGFLAPHLPDHIHLVPGHPVSGTEKSGPDAGFAELFDDRWCILTPASNADPEAVQQLRRFWQALGSRVEIMDSQHHDLVLAVTSHLPHLIAYNIVGTADDLENVTNSEVVKFSAGGFRDFTRIAASPGEFWRDVLLNNADAVLEMLARFTEDLTALQRAIRWRQGDRLLEQFERARSVRESIVAAGQETAEPDFGRRASAATAPEAGADGQS